jgi:hypothetical protein
MFVVTDADAEAIRAVYEQRGEFVAGVELRRLFPGITDNAQARDCARTIASWKPLAAALPPGSQEVDGGRLAMPPLTTHESIPRLWLVIHKTLYDGVRQHLGAAIAAGDSAAVPETPRWHLHLLVTRFMVSHATECG